MPELPEVQTIVSDLQKEIVGRRILDVWWDEPKLIKIPPNDFKKQIKGLKIEDIRRRGKNILFYLGKEKDPSKKVLLIHQKLTGHLLIGKWEIKNNIPESVIGGDLKEPVNGFIHLIFYLDDGRQLGLSDLRKFAKVVFGPRERIENLPELKEIGIDPLDKNFTFLKFKELIRFKKKKIKQLLMDQKVIAGIGNIYSDEILWSAGVHPLKLAYKLEEEELRNIYQAVKKILKEAIKLRGTSTSDYRDPAGKKGKYGEIRRVYQRENQPCFRCGNLIKRIKIGGRSAHFCPNCQKL